MTTVPTCPSRSDPYSLMPAAPHDAGAPHSSPGRGRILLGQPFPQDPPNGHAPDPGEGIGVRPAAASAIPVLEPCSEHSQIASTCLIPLAPSKPLPLFNRENTLLVQRRRLGSVVQRRGQGGVPLPEGRYLRAKERRPGRVRKPLFQSSLVALARPNSPCTTPCHRDLLSVHSASVPRHGTTTQPTSNSRPWGQPPPINPAHRSRPQAVPSLPGPASGGAKTSGADCAGLPAESSQCACATSLRRL